MSSSISVTGLMSFCMLFVTSAMAKYPDIGLPVDGRGGYLWNSNITFSVYPSSAYPQGGHYNITWANLDEIFNKNEQVNATAGICFGFCMVTFLNILALTPKSKRGLPLYIFNLLALATLAARYLNIMVTYTALEFGSAYYQIAGGYGDGETTQSVIGIGLTIWLPPFALIFVVVCLYLQGKCVLVLIALKRRYLYVAIITYLIGLSIFTIILRLVYAIFLTASFFNSNIFVPNWMRTTVLSTYTATILSWSLIFSWQVGIYIFNRCKIGASLDRREAMSILFMTGIESMLIPMIFTVLQYSRITWFILPEYLIMTSLACIIPFGSIWAGATNLQRVTAPVHCSDCSELMSNRPSDTTGLSGNTTVANTSATSPAPGSKSVFPSRPYNGFGI